MSSQCISSATMKTSLRQADFSDAPQFFGCPDAPCGVVGVAEQHQLHVRIGCCVFQRFEINGVGVVAANQLTFGGFTTAVGDRDEEMVVDGCLHQHFVAQPGQCPENGRQGRDHAGHRMYPFALRRPAVAPGKPPRDCRIVAFRDLRIAENTVLDPAAKRLDDSRCRPEIHICHPHRQYVRCGLFVPFHGVCAPPRDQLIEIVVHHNTIRKIAVEGFSRQG